MLQDIDLLVHALNGFLIPFISENALFVRQTVPAYAAAATGLYEPGEIVIAEAVVKLATSRDCLLKLLFSFPATVSNWLTRVGQWCRRIDHANDRILELEIFVRGKDQPETGPDDAAYTTNESENDIDGCD